ncbi:MAG: TlpA disulfide reductase family protein [Actinomycetota bacterium]|nr:TlpA disulfide reductase family protein [Actinomycetota bacterium]MDA2972688.1 TlpA disulfide reductase family protein [Actinomycetota bacterium]MDA3002052.1 TlpA disulfide reductase family protein [Actinomycetota bacterium]
MTRALRSIAVGMMMAITLVACGSTSDGVESVLLDEPGEYQEPGIAVNQPVRGQPFETAVVRGSDGSEFDVADLLGRPMVVNFWFSACPPCKREMPAIEEAHLRFGQTVSFVGVNPVDSEKRMNDFASEIGVTYTLLSDPDSELLVANGIAAFPTTLFIDANGVVTDQISGEVTLDMLTEAIGDLVS